MGIIVSAFPGCGKTFLSEQNINGIRIMDSDSSTFDKADFPENYINHIKENIDSTDILFISSHKEVRDALAREEINYDLFYPDKNRRIEFLQNYMRRGNKAPFIQKIDNNFDKWIDEIDNENNEFCHKHKMSEYNHFIGNDPMIVQFIKNITQQYHNESST